MKTPIPKAAEAQKQSDRSRISQSDIPSYSLTKALRVATAIADNYGKQPTKPLRVAEAMGMSPSSGPFRMLCGASIAYGLTEGGYNADLISLSPLAKRIVAPTEEGGDLVAKREATLKPRIVREFLMKYNDSKLPSESIAINVLEELGVPRDRAKEVLALILEGARDVGFLRDMKGSLYVDLETTTLVINSTGDTAPEGEKEPSGIEPVVESPSASAIPSQVKPPSNRVFITHGKNKDILNQIKELLTFGSFVPVVSVEQESVSKPVPDKVMDDMRSCSAAIVHVGTETKLLDETGQEHRILNSNVLIEIGACMALYGRRFILLVERGVSLPSNLQGLYEVRYDGSKLDYEATMKLLKAFNDFKN
ncbi:MAG TPA: TIR domain-containing protein [Terriglobales bacterium]|nr:TIR domain-containing protein [Terriglobales bacterium]